MVQTKQMVHLILFLAWIATMYVSKVESQSISFIPDGGRCRANRDCCRPTSNYGPVHGPRPGGFGYVHGGYYGSGYGSCRRYCSRVGNSYGNGVCISDYNVYCYYNKQDRKRCNRFPPGNGIGNPNSDYHPNLFNSLDKFDDQLEKLDEQLEKIDDQIEKFIPVTTSTTVSATTSTGALGRRFFDEFDDKIENVQSNTIFDDINDA